MSKRKKLGIFLPLGSGFKDQAKSGQDKRFVQYYLQRYNKIFDRIFIFSYLNEDYKLPPKCVSVKNKWNLHRFLYSFLIPLLNWQLIKQIDVFRVMQLTGTVPAILCRIFFQKKFVFTYGYDYIAFARLENKKNLTILLKLLEKIAMKLCSGVIVTTKTEETKLKKIYLKTKFFYVPNGVDINKLKVKNQKKGKIKTQKSKIKILTVARLEKQKNLVNLIKAIAILNKQFETKLLIIGQGKLELQIIRLKSKLNVDLKIIRQVSHDQITKYYKKADIFCLPSFLEGQPKVLLEAMAFGIPCLIGSYPGVEEFKNRKEVLITGFGAGEIARNLKELIKNQKLRKTLVKNSWKKIEKDFNINKLLSKEIDILKNV